MMYFRRNKGRGGILLYQDARDRWTIPKGHWKAGEQLRDSQEIGEETERTERKKGELHGWLGKSGAVYRRIDKNLVLMTTRGDGLTGAGSYNKGSKRRNGWMALNGFRFHEALDEIDAEDIGKLIAFGHVNWTGELILNRWTLTPYEFCARKIRF